MVAALGHRPGKALSPLLVEIVGLAGTGKTTLIRALNQRDGTIKIGDELQVRKLEHLPTFARYSPRVLTAILQRPDWSRRLSWDEIKSMVYLEGWLGYIRKTTGQEKVLLLDQGPVFKLATLHGFGPGLLRRQQLESCWTKMYQQWSGVLDLVVWLYAPETVLAKRIHTRPKRHEIKGKPEPEIRLYFERYQSAFEHVLAQLAASRALTMLQFDTSQVSANEIADEVLAALGVIRSGNQEREQSYARIYTHQ